MSTFDVSHHLGGCQRSNFDHPRAVAGSVNHRIQCCHDCSRSVGYSGNLLDICSDSHPSRDLPKMIVLEMGHFLELDFVEVSMVHRLKESPGSDIIQ